jgi:hypothetical protein
VGQTYSIGYDGHDQDYECTSHIYYRGLLLFDTSQIGNGVVTLRTLYLTALQSWTTPTYGVTNIVTHVVTTGETSLDVDSFYGTWGSVSSSYAEQSTPVVGGTAYGLSLGGFPVNGGGVTSIGLRAHENEMAVGPVLWSSSRHPTASYRPKLTVEYTEGFTPITLPSFRRRVA